jgi:hypothetical protein
VRAFERGNDFVERFFGGGAADFRPRTCAEALSWIRRSADEWLSAWASVLATTKSTPCTSAFIMLAMALPPAPPTPITLIRGRSSSTSGRMKSMLMSLNLPQTPQRVEPSR